MFTGNYASLCAHSVRRLARTLLTRSRSTNMRIWSCVMRSTILRLSRISSTSICATFSPISPCSKSPTFHQVIPLYCKIRPQILSHRKCHLFHKEADRQISNIRRAYDLRQTSTASYVSPEINRKFFSFLGQIN